MSLESRIRCALQAAPSVKAAAASLGFTRETLRRACRGSLGADYWACRNRGVAIRVGLAKARQRAIRLERAEAAR